jgi:hypothetical protein
MYKGFQPRFLKKAKALMNCVHVMCKEINKEPKPVNRLSVLFYCLILMLFFIVPQTFSQVLTINPEQTVNPVTGEMGFTLPRATVQDRSILS